jgi:hypothetical protein
MAVLFANFTKGVCAVKAVWVRVYARGAHGVYAV